MLIRFLVLFTALIIIGTVSLLEVAEIDQEPTIPKSVNDISGVSGDQLATLEQAESALVNTAERFKQGDPEIPREQVVDLANEVRRMRDNIRDEKNNAILKRNTELKQARYKIMLFSILGMWSLVLGLRWAITGKWRLWEQKDQA